MSRPALEVADIFRDFGPAWRRANAGHVSLDQLKVMSAVERCRTAALGGHVARCEDCAHEHVAYNSCRNRHCPKCQGATAKDWLAARQAELLDVAYFHLVFTLPKPPAAGPEAVLAYLARYTHRVAISNSRLVALDDNAVTFKWKDYRAPDAKGGRYRQKTMTLPIHEFIHRFLLHVLPKGFHRIRHYGLLANGQRAASLDRARALLAMQGDDQATDPDKPDEPSPHPHPCPKCGGPMVIIETFGPGQNPLRPQARDPPAGKAQAA